MASMHHDQIRFSDLQGLEGDIQVICVAGESGPALTVIVNQGKEHKEMTLDHNQIKRLKETGFKFDFKQHGETELLISPNEHGSFDCKLVNREITGEIIDKQEIKNFGYDEQDYFTFSNGRIHTASLEHRVIKSHIDYLERQQPANSSLAR